jgi:DNA-binding MarR family transcriptional regulator
MKYMPHESPERNRQLTEHILAGVDQIYRSLEPGVPHEAMSRWLSSDLTVAQLRVMLLLHTEGQLHMGEIAGHLSIALPTATGVVDKLVAKNMVLREVDAQDRRQVVCRLSPSGDDVMSGLWDVGRSQIARLLVGLTEGQLAQAANLIDLLYANLSAAARQRAEGK